MDGTVVTRGPYIVGVPGNRLRLHRLSSQPVDAAGGCSIRRRGLGQFGVYSGITGCQRVASSPGGWRYRRCTSWLHRSPGSSNEHRVPGTSQAHDGGFSLVQPDEGRRNYDYYFFGQHRYRNACRAILSGYTAEVIATFDRGKYSLYARWDANQWGGEDAGKWLQASITGPRVEEAIELRSILHTMRPASPGR